MSKKTKQKLLSYKNAPLSALMAGLVYLAAIVTFAVLIFLIIYILVNGIPYITPDLFALEYTTENVSLTPALINTIIMTFLSLLIAVPFGIFSAKEETDLWRLSGLRQRRFPEFLLSYMVCSDCCFLLPRWDGACLFWQVRLLWQS